jgi:hypothetical protein
MRRRARTDLSGGGASDGRLYHDNYGKFTAAFCLHHSARQLTKAIATRIWDSLWTIVMG